MPAQYIVFLFSKTMLSRLEVQYTVSLSNHNALPYTIDSRRSAVDGESCLLAVPFISMPLKRNNEYTFEAAKSTGKASLYIMYNIDCKQNTFPDDHCLNILLSRL